MCGNQRQARGGGSKVNVVLRETRGPPAFALRARQLGGRGIFEISIFELAAVGTTRVIQLDLTLELNGRSNSPLPVDSNCNSYSHFGLEN